MVETCAENFPPSINNPPPSYPAPSLLPTFTSAPTATTGHTATSSTSTSAPYTGAGAESQGLNLRAGGYELSVGGSAGSGLYRTQNDSGVGASFQLPAIPGQFAPAVEGIKDGAGRLWGNVRQRVEERVSRSGTPPAR